MNKLTLPKDEKELAEFQNKIDEMINSFNDYKSQVEVLSSQLDTALSQNTTLLTSVDHLTQAIKNIYINLNANNELFEGNSQIEEMIKEIGKFVISGESIKSGVRSEYKNLQN